MCDQHIAVACGRPRLPMRYVVGCPREGPGLRVRRPCGGMLCYVCYVHVHVHVMHMLLYMWYYVVHAVWGRPL